MDLATYKGQNVGIGQDRGAWNAGGKKCDAEQRAEPGTGGRSAGAGPEGRGVALA